MPEDAAQPEAIMGRRHSARWRWQFAGIVVASVSTLVGTFAAGGGFKKDPDPVTRAVLAEALAPLADMVNKSSKALEGLPPLHREVAGLAKDIDEYRKDIEEYRKDARKIDDRVTRMEGREDERQRLINTLVAKQASYDVQLDSKFTVITERLFTLVAAVNRIEGEIKTKNGG